MRAHGDGDDWVLDGQKFWITNAGVSDYDTVLAVTDPNGPRGGNTPAFVVEKGDEGVFFGAQAVCAGRAGLVRGLRHGS